MFLGDVKMGAQERKKTVIIIFGTYGSKTKKKFSLKKKRNSLWEQDISSVSIFAVPSHLQVLATFHPQGSARSSVTRPAGQQQRGVPRLGGVCCGSAMAKGCQTMHILPYSKCCLIYT